MDNDFYKWSEVPYLEGQGHIGAILAWDHQQIEIDKLKSHNKELCDMIQAVVNNTNEDKYEAIDWLDNNYDDMKKLINKGDE
tara:strand:- start:16 stop:261 length:246 start_codon:yes stop_codon:yes gene_type:complete